MKWWQIAQLILSNPAMQIIPIVGPLIPVIASGVNAAQHLHGDTNGDAKRELVLDGVQIAASTGKIKIDPQAALAITNAVLQSIDSIHQIAKDNQAPQD
jgi:hypothetical protein